MANTNPNKQLVVLGHKVRGKKSETKMRGAKYANWTSGIAPIMLPIKESSSSYKAIASFTCDC